MNDHEIIANRVTWGFFILLVALIVSIPWAVAWFVMAMNLV